MEPHILGEVEETFDRKLRSNGYKQRNGHNGEPIGNHHRSFEWCHIAYPNDLPSPQWGFHMPPRYANGHISTTGDPIHFMFSSSVGFSGSAGRIALFPVTSNPSWRQTAILDNFEWPYLRNGSFDPLIQRASHSYLCDSTAFLFILNAIKCCYFYLHTIANNSVTNCENILAPC